MPKKKTGARKKAEKQKKRQKDIRASGENKDVVQQPCDFLMVIASVIIRFPRPRNNPGKGIWGAVLS